jgi:hypothetical protein
MQPRQQPYIARRWSCSPLPRMRREAALTIERVGPTVAADGLVAEDQSPAHLDDRHSGGILAAFAVGRRLALVALAVLAILVLLPAVIAAQAASTL